MKLLIAALALLSFVATSALPETVLAQAATGQPQAAPSDQTNTGAPPKTTTHKSTSKKKSSTKKHTTKKHTTKKHSTKKKSTATKKKPKAQQPATSTNPS